MDWVTDSVIRREVLVALPCAPDQVRPATHLRGSLLATSFQIMREQGHEQRYFELLPRRLHQTIREISPGSWQPMADALAHYEVMGQLFPTPEQQVTNGKLSAERTQNAYVSTVVRSLRAAGALTFTTALKRVPAVFARLIDGGGAMAIYATGPKDARIELYGYPMLDIAYLRNGWQGLFASSLSLIARRVFVKVDPESLGKARATYLVAWV